VPPDRPIGGEVIKTLIRNGTIPDFSEFQMVRRDLIIEGGKIAECLRDTETLSEGNFDLVIDAEGLIVYDLETMAFIYNPLERAGLSSFDLPNMKKNADGSVTIYFGPKTPKELENNWIPTSGKRPAPTIRIYGDTEEFWNKSWEMPDVELVD